VDAILGVDFLIKFDCMGDITNHIMKMGNKSVSLLRKDHLGTQYRNTDGLSRWHLANIEIILVGRKAVQIDQNVFPSIKYKVLTQMRKLLQEIMMKMIFHRYIFKTKTKIFL
jgi:hypothetical protein